jgi:hypothetical protein
VPDRGTQSVPSRTGRVDAGDRTDLSGERRGTDDDGEEPLTILA